VKELIPGWVTPKKPVVVVDKPERTEWLQQAMPAGTRVAAPLTPATRGMFNAAMFARMKHDAMLVNWTRAEPDTGAVGGCGRRTIPDAVTQCRARQRNALAGGAREHAPVCHRREDVFGI
jgi:D-isomer specific 2-hydroxyacid dehydrogenase, NAD binding domain